jgi:hypothetical protein
MPIGRAGAGTWCSLPIRRSHPNSGYRVVFATEAKTPNQAIPKVRPLAQGRRFRAYLATGTYRDELADARWA